MTRPHDSEAEDPRKAEWNRFIKHLQKRYETAERGRFIDQSV